ncbi:hypothetical protein N9W12_05610 [Luminiphilus sp.]|jgi:hypothetical protein|nr:hypothetical protein [Luminiphilus sp.]MDA8738500.1 hypothetical protein [Luminiphilus sp.]MDB2380339.1 hypothetical protein [Luminiphilus sp.]MDC3393273.1 hypothetical protein [Luminiphilus sp.]
MPEITGIEHDMRFMSQASELTLKEGLDELYTSAPEVAAVSARKGKAFRDHDLTHVIFGCDTSITGEILLNPWILFGTTITRSELKDYAADPDVKRLNAEGIDLLGGRLRGYALFIVYYLPLYAWIWARHVRCMALKWPHSSVTEEMLNTPLSELRRLYGIRLYRS